MKFLPIVERELRVAARRWSTYWMRTWVAMLVIAASAWVVLANLNDPPQTVAQILFFSVAGGALLYCLLTGVRATADCLSEEKREGTLGLLFLTHLKGYDVVAGKLVANSLNSFYGLLAILPVVALALLMGGLTAWQIGGAAIALLNAMFLSVSIGMFASACCRSAQRAMSLTLLLLLLLAVGIPALGWWRAVQSRPPRPSEFYFACSPVFTFLSPYDLMGFGKDKLKVFARSVGVVHALGWVFLLLACAIAPRSWQERPAGVRRLRWGERWKLWSYGNVAERTAFRRRLLDANPFFWLAARDRLKPMWVWAMFGGVACIWTWGYGEFKNEWFNEGIYVATAFAVNSILKLWLATEAARQLTAERLAGTLELLLVTPLSIREILQGQALALRRQFFGPVAVAVVAEIGMLFAGTRESFGTTERGMWTAWWSAALIMLVADLIALYWVGLWMALASKNPKRVFSDVVGRVLAVPWVIFLVFLLFVAVLAVRGHAEVSWQVFLGFWFGAGLMTDLAFGLWARQKLLTEFREAATWRYQRRTAWWRFLFGSGESGSGAAAHLD